MKKSVLISLIALAVSVIGLIVALAAWKQKKKEHLYDDFDEDLLLDDENDDDYIAAHDFDAEEDNFSCDEDSFAADSEDK